MAPVGNVFSIDVEDWFHILDIGHACPIREWDRMESRVERNTDRLLALLDHFGVKCTCFILGWIAERHPALVKRICDAGHEIASHGYDHRLVYEQDPQLLRQDLERSISILQSVAGCVPGGYRAPGFSISSNTEWAFDVIAEAGFWYDSSVFPTRRTHGGMTSAASHIHERRLSSGRFLLELPISTTRLMGRDFAYCGGGYLRAFPYRFIASRIREANAAGEPVVVYVHPRDIDPDQPRLDMPLRRRLKSYLNLDTALDKLRRLLNEFSFTTACDVLEGRRCPGP